MSASHSRKAMWTAVAALLQALGWMVVGSAASARSAPESTSAFIDFGVPCKDPHPELDAPRALDRSKSAPRSNPATPLTQPPYPPLSRRMGEEGTAVLRLLISESGDVSEAHIARSTGSPRLDSAALEVTRGWHLTPGKVDGKPRCMWGKFAVSFVLTDYTDDELRQLDVAPEARALAQLLMGVNQLKDSLLNEESAPAAAERQIINLALDAASRQDEWIAAYDKVARILSFEFSPAELSELTKFYASPVASKWMSLNFKMMPTVTAQQQLVAQTLMCAVQGIDSSMKGDAPEQVIANDQLTEKYTAAIPRFVDAAIPYCTCLFNRANQAQRTGSANSAIADCGLAPRMK